MQSSLFIKCLIILSCVLCINNTYARQFYLDSWKSIYPDSLSGTNANCQLCHQNSGGGNGWNAYGWDIRQVLNGDINTAIRSVEQTNSDNDGANNIGEIESDQQPGWREDDNNTIYCKSPTSATFCDGQTQLTNQLSPDFSTLIADPILKGQQASLSLIADGFTAPNLAIPAPNESGFLYVVDQPGTIWKVDLDTAQKSVFLDVSNQILLGGERGLLGLAFHPDYANNGLLYTYQSEANSDTVNFPITPSDHNSVVAEWDASILVNSATGDQIVDTNTKREVIRIGQPQSNHNGGMIAFGPDNLLYISLGDGGGANDQGEGHSADGNGQDGSNLLGSMLRINPVQNGNDQYTIPADNPFIDDPQVLPEIYALGLRNVFRFSFDSLWGDLLAADVGQGSIEEISYISKGQNYGWPLKEGSFWFNNGQASTTPPANPPNNLADPEWEYDHDEGSSIIGGYLYRGSVIPEITGTYIFGDYVSKRIFYADTIDEIIRELDIVEGVDISILGFGQDLDNEIYVLGSTDLFGSYTSGKLYKIIPFVEPTPPVVSENDDLCFPIKTSNSKIAVICL